jgi:hypothetical protein
MTGKWYGRILFAVAALWNIFSAGLLFTRPDLLLAAIGVNQPEAQTLARSLGSSALTWGIAYALVALGGRRFRILGWLGALSKALFAAVYIGALFRGNLSLFAAYPALIELGLALLFVSYLWQTRKQPAEAEAPLI